MTEMSGRGWGKVQALRDAVAANLRAKGGGACLVRRGRTRSGVTVEFAVDADGTEHVRLRRSYRGGAPKWHTVKGWRLAFWPGSTWRDVQREELADGTVHLWREAE